MALEDAIPPFSPRLLLSLRESGYKFEDSLCEIIDNSIGHGKAKNIQIKLFWEESRNRTDPDRLREVFVADDGIGMDEKDLSGSLTQGQSKTYNNRESIGRFGWGLIAGTVNQCRNLEIYSKEKDGDWRHVSYNVLDVSEGKPIKKPILRSPPEKYTAIIKKSGTIVIWKVFDAADDFKEDWEIYNTQGSNKGDLGVLFRNLGRIYRKFIGDEIITTGPENRSQAVPNENICTITLNGKKVTPVDPLYMTKIPEFENEPKSTPFTEKKIKVNLHPFDQKELGKEKDDVVIRMSLLDKKYRPRPKYKNEENFNLHIHKNEGLSILRNGREVNYYIDRRIITDADHPDRYWGMEIEFPATLDKRFEIKNVKVGAIPDNALAEQISKEVSHTIKQARRKIKEIWDTDDAVEKSQKSESLDVNERSSERFEETGIGQDEITTEKTQAEIEIAANEIAERYRQFGQQIDPTKLLELHVQFRDNPNLPEESPFFYINYDLGTNFIEYNQKHPFFVLLDSVYKKIRDLSDVGEIEKLLGHPLSEELIDRKNEFEREILKSRYLFNLMIGSFVSAKTQTEVSFKDTPQVPSTTMRLVIGDWTKYLYILSDDKKFDDRVNV
ncbi:ATP-binding protein [Nitrosarchaeum sp.]|uniref:ATP-binding protein n=1 Tax=Nitrosarchaeum sp. TaxID=2026886 RepID=UPI00247C434E|nr:ATP-binding protein [Nitrosarchaeum sp.]MCV0411383.1 ATP-binding protein [Nitrosarchaeum sp.]